MHLNIEHTILYCTSNDRISMNEISMFFFLRTKKSIDKYCGEEREY
jgi:hypothetical protein